MKKIITLFFAAFIALNVSAATWKSTAIGADVEFKVSNPTTPAKDGSGKVMTVVYLTNLSCEKIGQNALSEDVEWLLNEGYRVIELDYAHHEKAVAPYLNMDIIAINDALNAGSFCGTSNISPIRAYVLFEGYRIQRDVEYYVDNPKVYNSPAGYSVGDKMYMDIAYPANPKREVPTVLSFSYSNSFHGKEHQRMYLGYTLSMFDDTIQEGLPAIGIAWAIADHPKYCDWGKGKPANGVEKDYGAIEVNPDAAKKVKSAIRTLRHFGNEVGLGSDVAVYGFSRGSTAASLAIGDAPFEGWNEGGYYPEESSEIQAAILGPGVFDYALMPSTSNEYKHMIKYCGEYSSSNELWLQQGGALAIGTSACPCFLFYNTNDEAYYGVQMSNLMSILDDRNVSYELMTGYGTGHSVPTKTADIKKVYDFLSYTLLSGTDAVFTPTTSNRVTKGSYTIGGMPVPRNYSGLCIVDGKKVIN